MILKSFNYLISLLIIFFSTTLLSDEKIDIWQNKKENVTESTNLKEKEIENLIIYKKAMYNADIASENELLDILNPLLKSQSVWKSHALLLMADYFEHNNNLIKSKDFLEEIVNSKLVNNEIKIEAERRLKRKFSD